MERWDEEKPRRKALWKQEDQGVYWRISEEK